ncbi:type II secretion system protein [uncultured Tateyamaria sp.]|uniref:type II secretion system protein n=1 Tax=uncultured Tateyamaria sp. TaxID=455651 RepID=UPI00262ED4F1|nr:type II secretion system protein [uncultured Tateyamaria sp.]
MINRPLRSGFTLLESMAAFAISAIALVALIAIVTQSVGGQATSTRQYADASFARAILEEYIVTYPRLPRKGMYKQVWQWTIIERPAERLRVSQFDSDFDLVEVAVRVTRVELPTSAFTLKRVVARRSSVD